MLATYATDQSTVTDQSSATSLIAMRQASKNILYTVVNSRAYDTDVTTGTPGWVKLVYVVDAILLLLIACLEYLAIKSYLKKKKETEPSVEATTSEATEATEAVEAAAEAVTEAVTEATAEAEENK